MAKDSQKLSISYILPVIDETNTLEATINSITRLAPVTIKEILIVVHPHKTTPASQQTINTIQKKHGGKIHICYQTLPGLGGAMQKAFARASGSYLMMMASDLETDPAAIPSFLDAIKQRKWDIVCGTRWIKGGGFWGYSKVKLILNFFFQKMISLLYRCALTDTTFGYRLYRSDVLKDIKWHETGHAFLLESLLVPLKQGARATEVSCVWRARPEGQSHGSTIQLWRYVAVAMKIRFKKITG